MYRVINKFSYLELRLFIMISISILIVVSDGKYNIFLPFKNYIEDSIYIFYRLCNQPIYIYNYISKILLGYKDLMLENDALHQELLLKNNELLLMEQYRQENYKLHDILCSSVSKINPKLIAQFFFTNTNSFNTQAMINRGVNNGVYIGQPIISDLGVVGQVIAVNKVSSRVLLISDRSHALSVKLKHNNTRMILIGCGHNTDLCAEYNADVNIHININDILVTSGLDGRFPEGYPVAIVSNIENSLKKGLIIIRARPIVNFQCLRYVVLIWT